MAFNQLHEEPPAQAGVFVADYQVDEAVARAFGIGGREPARLFGGLPGFGLAFQFQEPQEALEMVLLPLADGLKAASPRPHLALAQSLAVEGLGEPRFPAVGNLDDCLRTAQLDAADAAPVQRAGRTEEGQHIRLGNPSRQRFNVQ